MERLDHKFFNEEMKKIFDQFGKKNYSDHKLVLIYNEISFMDAQAFAKVIDELVGCCKFAPTLRDFRTASGGTREMRHEAAKKTLAQQGKQFWSQADIQRGVQALSKFLQLEQYDKVDKLCQGFENKNTGFFCQRCRNTGMVHPWKKEPIYKYLFKCFCKHGQARPENWPAWNDDLQQKGFRLDKKEIK